MGNHRDGPGCFDRRAVGVALAQLRPAVDELRPSTTIAHKRGDLRIRWLRTVCHVLLRGSAHLPGASVLRRTRGLHLLGLAGCDRACSHHASTGLHQLQGIRGTGVADRHPDHAGVGVLRHRLLRHHRQVERLFTALDRHTFLCAWPCRTVYCQC